MVCLHLCACPSENVSLHIRLYLCVCVKERARGGGWVVGLTSWLGIAVLIKTHGMQPWWSSALVAETFCVCRPGRQQVHWRWMWTYCVDSVVVLLQFSLLACHVGLIFFFNDDFRLLHWNTWSCRGLKQRLGRSNFNSRGKTTKVDFECTSGSQPIINCDIWHILFGIWLIDCYFLD